MDDDAFLDDEPILVQAQDEQLGNPQDG